VRIELEDREIGGSSDVASTTSPRLGSTYTSDYFSQASDIKQEIKAHPKKERHSQLILACAGVCSEAIGFSLSIG
jgi:hypothetical protein